MTTYTHNLNLFEEMPELWMYAKEHSDDPIRQVAAFLEDSTGKVLAQGANVLPSNTQIDWNDRELVRSVVSHAEIECLMNVDISKHKLNECTLYVTLEPCNDCRKVIELLGIAQVVYGEKYIPSDAAKQGMDALKS